MKITGTRITSTATTTACYYPESAFFAIWQFGTTFETSRFDSIWIYPRLCDFIFRESLNVLHKQLGALFLFLEKSLETLIAESCQEQGCHYRQLQLFLSHFFNLIYYTDVMPHHSIKFHCHVYILWSAK